MKEIIQKYDTGMNIAEIDRMYGKPPFTIRSIVPKT